MIRRLGPDEFELLRQSRLHALTDAPHAFGSTFEREHSFTDAEWRARLRPDGNPTFVWETDGEVGGMAVGAREAEAPATAHLLATGRQYERQRDGLTEIEMDCRLRG